MNKILINKCLLLTVIWGLASCKSTSSTHNAPIPDDFSVTAQQHVQAVEHWSNIANDLVRQTVIALEKHKLTHVPVYVKHPPVKSDFAVAFHDFLINDLVKKGIKVNRVNLNNTVFEYKIQSVEFNSDRHFPSLSKSGQETILPNGIVVRRNVSESKNSLQSQTETAQSGQHSWGNRAPKLELLISSAIVDNNIYLMKTTDIYYANHDDKSLYQYGHSRPGSKNNVFDDAFYHQ